MTVPSLSRLRCMLFGWHGASCRGRPDHVKNGKVIDPGRWSR